MHRRATCRVVCTCGNYDVCQTLCDLHVGSDRNIEERARVFAAHVSLISPRRTALQEPSPTAKTDAPAGLRNRDASAIRGLGCCARAGRGVVYDGMAYPPPVSDPGLCASASGVLSNIPSPAAGPCGNYSYERGRASAPRASSSKGT